MVSLAIQIGSIFNEQSDNFCMAMVGCSHQSIVGKVNFGLGIKDMRSSNDVWIANTATDDSLLSQPMSIPENGFDFNVTSLEDSFRTSAIDPPQEKKRND